MSHSKNAKLNKFVRFMVGKDSKPDPNSLNKALTPASNPDIFTAAIELSITPILTFAIGFLIDRHFHTLPWFSLSGLGFGVLGSILRLYYGLTGGTSSEIGVGDESSASMNIRSKNVVNSNAHSLMNIDLQVPDDVRESAIIVDGSGSKGYFQLSDETEK